MKRNQWAAGKLVAALVLATLGGACSGADIRPEASGSAQRSAGGSELATDKRPEGDEASSEQQVATETVVLLATETPTATPTFTVSATATATETPTRTPTSTSTLPPTATASPSVTVPPAAPVSKGPKLVLADYFAWYGGEDWGACYMSGGDAPLEPYNSDDAGAIGRHIDQARSAGIDAFTLQWTGPGSRTDRNFATLMGQAEARGFKATIVSEQHFFNGWVSQQSAVDALRHVMGSYSEHPAFLRVEGRPVLFFIDMQRVPTEGGQSPIDAWAAIRAQVDPGYGAIWIAEGDDSKLDYLRVFDGLYTYKITHSGIPDAYTKLPAYGAAVRARAAQLGREKYWVATVMPGWDDLNSRCRGDVRVPSPAHRVDRADGAFYRATFDSAMASHPDWLFVNSFNEWVEGHYIEPSAKYGHRYIELTREFAQRFKQ